MIEFTCRGCSLLCDDVKVDLSDGNLKNIESGCGHVRQWVSESLQESEASSEVVRESLKLASSWVKESRALLVCGLGGLTLEAETKVINWAIYHQAYLSAETAVSKIESGQNYGGASCTLGEIQQRADLILVGNFDLVETHPHFEKKFFSQPGRFLSDGSKRRLVFLGDPEQLKNKAAYETIVPVQSSEVPEALTVLRRLVKNPDWNPAGDLQKDEQNCQLFVDSLTPEILAQLRELVQELKNSQYPVLFRNQNETKNEIQWTKFLTELNDSSRLHSLFLPSGPSQGNVSDTILAMTGFPDHLCFRPETVQYDPYRFRASRLIEKQEVDLIIFVGDEITPYWQTVLDSASPSPKRIQIHSGQKTSEAASSQLIEFQIQKPGIHEAGTALRCDGVPLPLRKIAESKLPTAIEIFEQL